MTGERKVVHRVEDGMDRQEIEATTYSPEWAAWFSGFFDGEGSIACLATVHQDGGRRVIFRISITQRLDEAPLLHEIAERLGGRVYERTGGRTAAWHLDGATALSQRIVPLFQRHRLRTKKALEWSLVAPLVVERAASGRYLTDEFYARVAAVALALSEGRGTWTHLRRERRPRPMQRLGRPARSAKPSPAAGS